MAKLIAEEGQLQGMELPLEGANSWIIGRDPDTCQILVEDPSISRRHVSIQAKKGKYLLENLSETNPAEINGEKVKDPTFLNEGDRVKLGALTFQFTLQDLLMPSDFIEEELLSDGEKDAEKREDAFPQEEDREENLFEGKLDTIFDEDADEERLLAEIDFNIPEDSRWLLKVISGPNSGAEFHLQPDVKYIIGADSESADIVFYDTSVSKKHASLILEKEGAISIEDLRSKNGVAVDGEKIEGKATLSPSSVISMGTTSFVVFDRESEMQTIISPLMPSIVNTLKKREEEEKKEEEKKKEKESKEENALSSKSPKNTSSFVLIALIMGFFLLIGIGALSLFQSQPVEKAEVQNAEQQIKTALMGFPGIQYTYSPNSQTLFIVGHVLTDTAKRQLDYQLQGLTFLKRIDDTNIIIDEFVWKEVNTILAKNPEWRGVTIQATEPGRFSLTGYLLTRKQKEALTEYLNGGFPYLDRLTSQLVVEEDLLNSINDKLSTSGLRNVTATLSAGRVVLKGRVAMDNKEQLDALVEQLRNTNGIRNVDLQIFQEETPSSIVDITDRYLVSGVSKSGDTLSVIVDGRILSVGDFLDGMQITEISPSQILLEKEGVKYRIRLR